MDSKTGVLPSSGNEFQAVSSGAYWRRVDLHLHTPGVFSFKCPNGSDLKSESGRRVVVSQYVDALLRTGIEVGAITDYNGIRAEWYPLLRDEAAKRGVVLLPGAELSLQVGKGLHVLVVFEQSADIGGIDNFLCSLDRDPATPLYSPDRSHRDITLRDNVLDELKRLRERFDCLFIFPQSRRAERLV